jgi:DNA-binding transcriptional ArsR family regulator
MEEIAVRSKSGATQIEEHAKRIAELLKVLANENRLLILCALMEGPKTVSSLCEKISSITQPALSQHLALLKAHGILTHAKSGQNVTYSIEDSRVEEIMAVIRRLYCDL